MRELGRKQDSITFSLYAVVLIKISICKLLCITNDIYISHIRLRYCACANFLKTSKRLKHFLIVHNIPIFLGIQ